MSSEKKKIPEKVVKRLTSYHSILIEYIEEGIESISSPQIASRLKIDDSQVRKDFKILNNVGRCGVGYSVTDLKKSIEETFNFKKSKDAFIVGAGYVGIALAKYDNFTNYGLNVKALFDNDPVKIDMKIGDKQVYHISKLPELVKELNVNIAVLTIPRQYAQKTADILVKAGIKYIWNFTSAILKVPDDVKVWNESLIASFLQFACTDID